MSYSYERVERRSRTTSGGSSFGVSGRRSVLGYWIPLFLTVTAATVGFAAWIWSERQDDEDSSEEEQQPGGGPPPGYSNMSGGLPPGPGPSGVQEPFPGPMGPPLPGDFQGPPPGSMAGLPPGGFQGPPPGTTSGPPSGYMPGPLPGSTSGPPGGNFGARSASVDVQTQEDTSLVGRVSSVIRKAPSPGQSYDWAAGKVVAGAAAAGAMIGGALGSISEGSQDKYEDHERWGEEAESRDKSAAVSQGIKRRGTAHEFFEGQVEMPQTEAIRHTKRKNVAIVVSAVERTAGAEDDLDHHASILAHLPEQVNLSTTRVFVLINAPELKAHPLSQAATSRLTPSMTSSFSNISQGDAHTPGATPGEFPGESDGPLANAEPNPLDESTSLYKTLHNQASILVEKDSMVMPFTSRSGHVHILRSLAPEIVYIQESLCGHDGDIIASLSGWVRQSVVVIGDEGGHGGLVDTDDEMASAQAKRELWWQKEERTGLGKGVAVVESLKIADDWRRRVNDQD